jgi:hypothetical protein
MRGDVIQLACPVAGGSDDCAVADDCRADRYFAARAGDFGLVERTLHEAVYGGVHSPPPGPSDKGQA